jgi:hypothetical protein
MRGSRERGRREGVLWARVGGGATGKWSRRHGVCRPEFASPEPAVSFSGWDIVGHCGTSRAGRTFSRCDKLRQNATGGRRPGAGAGDPNLECVRVRNLSQGPKVRGCRLDPADAGQERKEGKAGGVLGAGFGGGAGVSRDELPRQVYQLDRGDGRVSATASGGIEMREPRRHRYSHSLGAGGCESGTRRRSVHPVRS